MTRIDNLAGGLGTGALLLMVAAALAWRSGLIDWLWKESSEDRIRHHLERAQRSARRSPDFLEICRAAGL